MERRFGRKKGRHKSYSSPGKSKLKFNTVIGQDYSKDSNKGTFKYQLTNFLGKRKPFPLLWRYSDVFRYPSDFPPFYSIRFYKPVVSTLVELLQEMDFLSPFWRKPSPTYASNSTCSGKSSLLEHVYKRYCVFHSSSSWFCLWRNLTTQRFKSEFTFFSIICQPQLTNITNRFAGNLQ